MDTRKSGATRIGEKLIRRLGRGATLILASAILTACAYGQGISWNGANTSSPAIGRSYLPSFEEVIDSFAPSAHAAPVSPAADDASASGWQSGPNPLQTAQKTDQPGSSAGNSGRLNFLNRLKRRLRRP